MASLFRGHEVLGDQDSVKNPACRTFLLSIAISQDFSVHIADLVTFKTRNYVSLGGHLLSALRWLAQRPLNSRA